MWIPHSATLNLLPDDLNQYTFCPSAVKFAIKDLLPGAEVQLAGGDPDHDLAAHDLTLVVRVGVVLAGAIVLVPLWRWIEWRESLQPFFIIGMQARLIIVDEYAGRDVHGVHQAQPFANAAAPHCVRHLGRDVQ